MSNKIGTNLGEAILKAQGTNGMAKPRGDSAIEIILPPSVEVQVERIHTTAQEMEKESVERVEAAKEKAAILEKALIERTPIPVLEASLQAVDDRQGAQKSRNPRHKNNEAKNTFVKNNSQEAIMNQNSVTGADTAKQIADLEAALERLSARKGDNTEAKAFAIAESLGGAISQAVSTATEASVRQANALHALAEKGITLHAGEPTFEKRDLMSCALIGAGIGTVVGAGAGVAVVAFVPSAPTAQDYFVGAAVGGTLGAVVGGGAGAVYANMGGKDKKSEKK